MSTGISCLILFIRCLLYNFTHSVWGSTLTITITEFLSAFGLWAPFSLVSRQCQMLIFPNFFLARRVHSDWTNNHWRNPSSWCSYMASRAGWTWCFLWTWFGGWDHKGWSWVGGPLWSDLWLFPQLSCVKFASDVKGVQNEDSDCEAILDEHETNGRVNGVGRSHGAVSST